MKNITIKKVVLFSIGLIALIMLVVGLSFEVITLDLGVGELGGAVTQLVGMKATGFDMLSFNFSTTLIEFFKQLNLVGYQLVAIFIGILSIITILIAVLSFLYYIYAFIKKDLQSCQNKITLCLVLGLVACVLYTALSIVFVLIVNGAVNMYNEQLGSYYELKISFKTSAYISLIIQVVLFAAFIVCKVAIKEKSSVVLKNEENGIDSILNAEFTIIELLREYKALYDDNVIGAADYMAKKVKIMKAPERKVKQNLQDLTSKVSLEKLVNAEMTITKILREYKTLLEKNIISDADFVEKKVSLLSYVID